VGAGVPGTEEAVLQIFYRYAAASHPQHKGAAVRDADDAEQHGTGDDLVSVV
jgi:hypothetical protein